MFSNGHLRSWSLNDELDVVRSWLLLDIQTRPDNAAKLQGWLREAFYCACNVL